MKPMKISDAEAAFPAHGNKLLPPKSDIPESFDSDNKWHDIAYGWFYFGLPKGVKFYPKDGIDPKLAMRHLKAALGSFEPKHEDKMTGVAWLLSQWFDDVRDWETKEAKKRLAGKAKR